jgi:hypothetical protein
MPKKFNGRSQSPVVLAGAGSSGRQTLRGCCRSGVTNFHTLWRFSKNFKFLKEVKIL